MHARFTLPECCSGASCCTDGMCFKIRFFSKVLNTIGGLFVLAIVTRLEVLFLLLDCSILPGEVKFFAARYLLPGIC